MLAVLGFAHWSRLVGAMRASALLTPPDVISQILLAVPMVILFEGGLITSRILLNKREAGDARD